MYCCTRRNVSNKDTEEKIPTKKFKDGTTELDLSNENLKDADMKKIISLLSKNTSLKQLTLSRNKIGNNGARILGEGLVKNKTLDTLEMNASIPLDKFRKETRDLDVSSQCYKDIDVIIISYLMKNNSSITKLNLSLNSISNDGAEALANILKKNDTLTNLNLANNDIGDSGASFLGKSLEINNGIKTLNLGDNDIRDEGIKAIATSLEKNTTLTQLLLYMNTITDDGVQKLADALERNTSLIKLQLNQNNITSTGAKALASVLEKNKTFLELHLSQNKAIMQSGRKSLRAVSTNDPKKIIKM